MIIVRAPVRIPIGGGGTDLPSYYSLYGGEWTSAAINKYVYIALNKRFEKTLRISYSRTEEIKKPEEVQHPIVRETLKLLGIDGGIEIVSIADVPSNTGLGTSASFTVALLTALHAFLRNSRQSDLPPRREIAEQACHIAMNLLKEPSGKQDEYIAAYGGVTSFSANKNGEIKIEPLYPQKIAPETIRELENNLLMFYTGVRRESRDALKIQEQATQTGEKEIIENLHRVKEIGREIREALSRGDFHQFGKLLDLHWQEKIKRQGTSNPQINRWYEIAKEAGAIGGKLMGAGGGGFFIFYCENQKDKLRKAMTSLGFKEEQFHFDLEGVKVIADFI
jgi:D-glycero-alpha-D-manno-heptose-7-phosphate kinase